MCECGIDKDNENFREDSEKHKFYEFKIVFLILRENRSSRSDMIFKWSDLKNIVKFTGKHLRRSHFFNTVARWRPATLLRRDYGTGVSCEFCETFKNTGRSGRSGNREIREQLLLRIIPWDSFWMQPFKNNNKDTRTAATEHYSYYFVVDFRKVVVIPTGIYLLKSIRKHQNNGWNLFKVINKDTRITSMILYWCHYC